MDTKKKLYQLTVTTGVLEPSYSVNQIGELWNEANILNDIVGFNVTKQGHKFEFKLDNLNTYTQLLHKGLNDEINNTIIKLYPVYQPTRIVINFTNVPLGASTEAVEAVILAHHPRQLRSINTAQLHQTVQGISFPTGRWKVTVELEDDDEWYDMQTFTTMFPGRYVGTTHSGQMRPPPSRNNSATPIGNLVNQMNSYASTLKQQQQQRQQPAEMPTPTGIIVETPEEHFAWNQPPATQALFAFIHPTKTTNISQPSILDNPTATLPIDLAKETVVSTSEDPESDRVLTPMDTLVSSVTTPPALITSSVSIDLTSCPTITTPQLTVTAAPPDIIQPYGSATATTQQSATTSHTQSPEAPTRRYRPKVTTTTTATTTKTTTLPPDYEMQKVFYKRRPPVTDDETNYLKPDTKLHAGTAYKFTRVHLKPTSRIHFGESKRRPAPTIRDLGDIEMSDTPAVAADSEAKIAANQDDVAIDGDPEDKPPLAIEIGLLKFPEATDNRSIQQIVQSFTTLEHRLVATPKTYRQIAVYTMTNFGDLPLFYEHGIKKVNSDKSPHVIAANILSQECGGYDYVLDRDPEYYLKHFNSSTIQEWKNITEPSLKEGAKTFIKLYNEIFDKRKIDKEASVRKGPAKPAPS